jgi:hypothetical protein
VQEACVVEGGVAFLRVVEKYIGVAAIELGPEYEGQNPGHAYVIDLRR